MDSLPSLNGDLPTDDGLVDNGSASFLGEVTVDVNGVQKSIAGLLAVPSDGLGVTPLVLIPFRLTSKTTPLTGVLAPTDEEIDELLKRPHIVEEMVVGIQQVAAFLKRATNAVRTLLGKEPNGDTLRAIIAKLLQRNPQPAIAENAERSMDLHLIILRALGLKPPTSAKKPKNREAVKPLNRDFSSTEEGEEEGRFADDARSETYEEIDFDALGIDSSKPIVEKPGTEGKVRMLAARYAAGVPLWHINDRNDHGSRSVTVLRDAVKPAGSSTNPSEEGPGEAREDDGSDEMSA